MTSRPVNSWKPNERAFRILVFGFWVNRNPGDFDPMAVCAQHLGPVLNTVAKVFAHQRGSPHVGISELCNDFSFPNTGAIDTTRPLYHITGLGLG